MVESWKSLYSHINSVLSFLNVNLNLFLFYLVQNMHGTRDLKTISSFRDVSLSGEMDT